MAMNKTEKAEMDRLRGDLAKARALRWPDYRPERIDVESTTEALLKGEYRDAGNVCRAWWINPWHREAHLWGVGEGCFGSVNHSNSYTDRTNSQGQGGPWFPTKRDALMALRVAKTEEFAGILAKIDERIAEAE